jgi:hypothetical protein
MSKLRLSALIAASSLFMAGQAFAGTCEIKYTRTACPDKEKISFKKCNGKASCSKFKEAASPKACGEIATASCKNKRLKTTKSKVIAAEFDGVAINAANGSSDFCTVYENAATEFNKC